MVENIRNRLKVKYFVTNDETGSIFSTAIDAFGNEFNFKLVADGSILWRKNEGLWQRLGNAEAAAIRYFIGTFRKDPRIAHYHTKAQLV